MTQPRIAICISGQIRTDDDRLARLAEAARLCNADVFLSVWKKRGGKSFDSGHMHVNLRRIFGPEIACFLPRPWADFFTTAFPEWRSLLPPRKPVTRALLGRLFSGAVIDIEDEVIDFDYRPEANSLRMLYRIWRCNGLKRLQERKTGLTYDRVIRMRPDMILNFASLLNHDCAEGDLLIKGRRGETLHDSYWCCTSQTDDIMANLFGHALLRRHHGWQGIHHELPAYVELHGLNPINVRAATEDFTEFGDYPAEERAQIIRSFRQMLETSGAQPVRNAGPDLTALMVEALQIACDHALGQPVRDIGPLVAQAQALLDNPETADQGRTALPTLAMLLAADTGATPELRINMALLALLDDALTGNPAIALRCETLPILLAGQFGVLVRVLEKNDPVPGDDGHALAALIRAQLLTHTEADLSRANAVLRANVTSNSMTRARISDGLRAEGDARSLSALAQMYLEAYPQRRNAHTFAAQARRYAANTTHETDSPNV